MTKIIFNRRRSFDVIRPGYNMEPPEVFMDDGLRSTRLPTLLLDKPFFSLRRRERRIDVV